MILELAILFTMALACTLGGAHYFIEGSSRIAKDLGIPDFFIGFTILAFGTSLPETATTISAIYSGENQIVTNTILGSNIVNVALGIGLGMLFAQGRIASITPAILTLLVTIAVGLFTLNNALGLIEGVLLLCAMVGISFYLMREQSLWQGQDEIAEPVPASPNSNSVKVDAKRSEIRLKTLLISSTMTVGALTVLVVASNYLIVFTIDVGEVLHVPAGVIALFALAAGTSGPEIIISIQTAIKGKLGLLYGNIAGSNLFNLTVALALPAILKPPLITDITPFLGAAILLFTALLCAVPYIRGKLVKKLFGSALIITYFIGANYYINNL